MKGMFCGILVIAFICLALLAALQLGETKEGPYVLREPVVAFSTGLKEGLLGSSAIGGLIGGEILQRFTVTFDYPHHQILVEPNSRFADPFRKNESGLSVLARGKDFHRFEVDDVGQGWPAELAGVRLGDLLTALGGHPASELDLDKIDRILQQPGSVIPITILREGRTLKMTLSLNGAP